MLHAPSHHYVWNKVVMPEGYSLGRSHALSGDTVIIYNKTGEYIAVCDAEYDCTLNEKRYAGMLLPTPMRNSKTALDTFRWRFKKDLAIRNTNAQDLIMQLCVMHRMEIKL